MIIDAHCHVGEGRFISQTADELLRQMDAAGIDLAVICPVDQQIVVDNREGNDAMLAACRAHPDRFRGLAVANPWYGQRAVEELRRAFEGGLAGLKVHASRQGHYINDDIVDPLFELVSQVHGFAYLHLGTSEYSLPLEVIDLARRFPDVSLILGHAGGADVHWPLSWEVLDACPNTLAETSHLAFTGQLHSAVTKLGAGRFVFGSDSPVGAMAVEKWKLERLGLHGSELIFGGNVQRLLRRRGVLP